MFPIPLTAAALRCEATGGRTEPAVSPLGRVGDTWSVTMGGMSRRADGTRGWRAIAVALRAAAVAAVVGAVATTSTACTDTTAGSAERAADTASATTITSAAPAVVPTTGIKGKLLSLGQLGAIVGDTDMRPLKSYTEPDLLASGIDPFGCRPAVLMGTSGGYFQKARQAMVGDTNRGTDGQVAAQVISVFASRGDTANFLNSFRLDWASCIRAGTFTAAGEPEQHWDTAPIEEAGSRLSTTVTRQEPPLRTCHHVVAAQANVAVEALACGDGDTNKEANAIVDALLAKFPT